jgi:intraflagellar transport protein 88
MIEEYKSNLLNFFFLRRRFAEHVIVTAAKIVGNNSDGDFVGGYEWCIEQVRNSTYLELASGLEIQKAIAYLREDDFPKVRIKQE